MSNRIIVNSFANDGLPGWFLNPTRGFTAEQIRSGAVPQAPRVIAHDFRFPVDWQSSIGFQKQITNVLGFEMDLTHWKEYSRSRARDINLVPDPATGYPAATAVADPAWGPILWIEPHGEADSAAEVQEAGERERWDRADQQFGKRRARAEERG